MSTAILYSGQARTIAQCLPSQHWHVYRHFSDPHFFIVWQNEPNAVAGVKLLEDKYGKERVHAKLITDPKTSDLPMIPLPKGAHAPWANLVAHSQLMMQHWYQNEVWKFYLEAKGELNPTAIIRMRGDNFFHYCNLPKEPLGRFGKCHSPYWGRFGGINDRFAIMDDTAAKLYFTVYEMIPALLEEGCPFHPESLSKAAILKNGPLTSNDRLDTLITTKRLVGQDRPPEIMAHDIAHFAASSH